MTIVSMISEGYQLKYNKPYIGLAKDSIAKNFVYFQPQKSTVVVSIKHPIDENFDALLNESDLEKLAYDRQWNNYRVRITNENDIQRNEGLLKKLFEKAYQNYKNIL